MRLAGCRFDCSWLVTLSLISLLASGRGRAEPPEQVASPQQQQQQVPPGPAEKDPAAWKELFDGKELGAWVPTKFGGSGDIYVEDGAIVLEIGSSLTGINFKGELPTSNYEIALEAQRAHGNDFFCGLTFPVGKSHCSLILGGWGGAVVGLSSIDGQDASENATTQYIGFKDEQWHAILVRVTDERIQVELDGKQIMDQQRAGHEFTTRSEVDASKPLGIATWETCGKLRKIRLRQLPQSSP